jgi:hypothetical protein
MSNKYLEKIAVSDEFISKRLVGVSDKRRLLSFGKVMRTGEDKYAGEEGMYSKTRSDRYTRAMNSSIGRSFDIDREVRAKDASSVAKETSTPGFTSKSPYVPSAAYEAAIAQGPAKPAFKLGAKGKIGLGIGTAGALGLGAYALSRKKDMSS